MKFHSNYNLFAVAAHRKAFTIAEVIAATMLLAFIASSVMMVINRAMVSTMDA